MFKKIFLSLLIVTLLFSGTVVFAQKSAFYEELKELESIVEELLKILDIDKTKIPLPVTPSSVSGEIPADFLFTQNLARGAKGKHVKYLQILLNKDTATKVAESGSGSPGNETEFFGPATFNAVRRFQQKYIDEVLKPIGLTIPTGFVGAKTREKLNAILKGEFRIVPSDPPTVPPLPVTPQPSSTPAEKTPEETPTEKPAETPEETPTEKPAETPKQETPKEETPLPVASSPCKGQSRFIDIRRDSNEHYELVEIGSQCWMAKNMNYPVEGSWCYGDNNANCEKYGRLYNYETAKTVCPTGYKLPTDGDFKILERQLGMSQAEADKTGWRGTNEGSKLKSQVGWDGNNESGFTVLPAGGREDTGTFSGLSSGANFWTSTESGNFVWGRSFYSGFWRVNRNLLPKEGAISVRCIKI
jgi:uncharacterized protein (TIGR02145 family)